MDQAAPAPATGKAAALLGNLAPLHRAFQRSTKTAERATSPAFGNSPVDYTFVKALFEPWQLGEKPVIKALSAKAEAQAARRLPGRGKKPKATQSHKATPSREATSHRKSPAAPHRSTSVPEVSIQSSGVRIQSSGVSIQSSGVSSQLGGGKRGREAGGGVSSVVAALAAGNAKAAKRMVHTAGMRRAQAAGAAAAQAVAKERLGWDGDGSFHGPGGVVLPRSDEVCRFAVAGRCSAPPGKCPYSHDLGQFPCRYAHGKTLAALQEALQASAGLSVGGFAWASPTASVDVSACPVGDRCRFSHATAADGKQRCRLVREALRLWRKGQDVASVAQTAQAGSGGELETAVEDL